MPKNLQVLDIKPRNMQVLDTKPQLAKITGELTRGYLVTLGAGQYMGLPFLLTYPSALSVTQWSEKV